MGKASLRERYRLLRDAAPPHEQALCDSLIAKRLLELPAYQAAGTLFSYLSFGSEVSTRGLIERTWADGKTVALPRCIPETHGLAWHRVGSFEELSRGPYGIDEPLPCDTSAIDAADAPPSSIAIVPGLVFDRRGFRLGYGGGYYDRFLASFQGVSIGLCRSAFLAESLSELGAIDAHDRAVDIVLTETEALAF